MTEGTQLIRGLEGVVAAETELCDLDGTNGRLAYRGFDIDDLARRATFEEVAFLLRRTSRYLIYARTVNRGPGREVEFDGVSQILVRDIQNLEILHPKGEPRVHCEKCGDEMDGLEVAAVLCGPCWHGGSRS